ncbi:hypothetical protein DOY81_003536, partial [Sarcophaga bullata]
MENLETEFFEIIKEIGLKILFKYIYGFVLSFKMYVPSHSN